MKHFLLFFLLIPILAFAQVPQGVGYQGVATDALGIELVNQSISIRVSILSGSATGNIEWQETHNTSTDTFGLFTLSIGEGISTGNGALTSFTDITWGANTHFLKIEMDVNGGTNYSNMGTNQMMSVPYALYAENANINYDSISNNLSNDSTFITNVGGGVGGGCDFLYPEGYDGNAVTEDIDSYGNTYTVPAGKRLYVTGWWSGNATIDGFSLNIPDGRPLILNAGQILGAYSGNSNFNGYLVDEKIELTAVTEDIDSYGNTYTVPAGKRLYVAGWWSGNATIDGFSLNIPDSKPLILNAGQILGAYSGYSNFNGYLVDENYFANCGGGGSSSSTIDSLIEIVSQLDSIINTIICVYGCIDSLAINYDSLATCGNSSCVYTPTVGMCAYGGVVYRIEPNVVYVVNVNNEVLTSRTLSNCSSIVSALTTNGYTDWQIPSPTELDYICPQRYFIDLAASSCGGIYFGSNTPYVSNQTFCNSGNNGAGPYCIPYDFATTGGSSTPCMLGGYSGNCCCQQANFYLRSVRTDTF